MRQCWSACRKAELTESTSPRGLTFHCTDKAGYTYFASLHICRVALLLLRGRRCSGLGELQRARVAETVVVKYFPTALCTVPKAREVGVVNPVSRELPHVVS
jgi:hypothetical protein